MPYSNVVDRSTLTTPTSCPAVTAIIRIRPHCALNSTLILEETLAILVAPARANALSVPWDNTAVAGVSNYCISRSDYRHRQPHGIVET